MPIDEVCYCGLYCGLCSARRRIPQRAEQLKEVLQREGYDRGHFDLPDLQEVFPVFWKGLELLATRPCPGCRAGGGNPDCAIRACACERHVVGCPQCPDYPCAKLELLKNYPCLLSDGERCNKIGLEQWIDEQEARAQAGFSYSEIRHPAE